MNSALQVTRFCQSLEPWNQSKYWSHPGRCVKRPGCDYITRSLLDGEYPDHAALRYVVLEAGDMSARQCILDALRVDAPARLDGDILGTVDFIGHRHAHNAGVGLLLPKDLTRLRIEGPEHPVVGSSGKDQIAGGRGYRAEQLRFGEVMRPDLLARRRIPRLQLAKMIAAGCNRQTDIFGLGAEPELAWNQRHSLAGKAAAEVVVGGNVDQSGFLAVGRRRPILATPQRRTEFNPLAHDWLVLGVDDRPAGLGLDAFPDIGFHERPAGHIVDAVRLAFEHPENRITSWMDEALERTPIPLQVDQHRRIHLVPVP